MAHAAEYEHDIFISYAHDDNHAPGSAQGWVDQFHAWLESWLTKRRGMKRLSIWRDGRRMSGNTLFDDAIQEAVNGSALFFALVSRNYLNSAYCRDELFGFHQRHGATPAGLKVGDQYRIFTLLLNNIPHDQYQQTLPPLKGTTGFAFHDAATDEERGDFTAISDERFEKQLRPLVDAVEAILEPLATPSSASIAIEHGKSPDTVVFLADVAETLQPFRTRILAEIESRQATILPTVPPPWEYEGHQEEIRKIMGEARFSIHLFDQLQGRTIIDRQETTYPHEQFAIARESAALPLVWVPPDLEIETIENQNQRQFLLACANSERQSGQYEFVRAPQSAFINLVLEKIAQPVPVGLPVTAGQSYLVDTHQKDQRYAFDLAGYLAKFDVDVDVNKESRDALRSLALFEHAVQQAKNLVIIFGKVTPDWLHARIKLAVKAICEQFQGDQSCCLENIWIYKVAAGQDEDLPPLPPIININILDNSHSPSIDPAVAGQLLGAAAGAGGGL